MEVPVDFDNDVSITYTYSVTFTVRLQTKKIQCTIYGQKYLTRSFFFFFKFIQSERVPNVYIVNHSLFTNICDAKW